MNAAKKASTIAPNRSGSSDDDLLAAALAHDDLAWRRFVARYEPPLRAIVRQASETELEDDQVDDVIGDFWLAVVADDMRLLRAFNPAHGSQLITWLTFHVAKITTQHVRRITREAKTSSFDEARYVSVPQSRSGQEGVIDLRREIIAALRTPDGERAITEVLREIMEAQQRPAEDNSLLDADAAAALLAMTPSAVRKAALRGSLPCRRLGRKLRFVRSELMAAARR